jgi:hypothetical protein
MYEDSHLEMAYEDRWVSGANHGRLQFPGHDLIVHGLPTWWSTTILDWAEETGRLAA